MAALSFPYDARRKDGALLASAVGAGARVFKGGLVTVASATGLVQAGADSAGLVFVGVAYESVDNTGGAAGAKAVRVHKNGVFTYAKAGAVQADVGKTVFLVDDATVSIAATANSIVCGTIVGVPDGAHVQVRIDGRVS